MSAEALGIIWAPNLLRSPKERETIEDFDNSAEVVKNMLKYGVLKNK